MPNKNIYISKFPKLINLMLCALIINFVATCDAQG